MPSSIPTDNRRRSAPSLFTRLGLFKRQPKLNNKQVDYRSRWPTVTTLVEQRSDSCFSKRDPTTRSLHRPAKVKALETASVPLRWLHHRLESVQDHLDHSIEVAEAKALKRATSMSEKLTRPGESTHPYDTGVEAQAPESTEEDHHDPRTNDSSTGTTGTLLKFETNITAKPSPPPPPPAQNKWRLPFTGAAKSPRPSSEHSHVHTDEEDIAAGGVPQSQWKSAKTRRPTTFPDRKASSAASTSSRRRSSGGGKKAGGTTPHASTTSNTPKHSPEPSSSQHHRKQQSSHHPRRESVVSAASRRSSPRTVTPSQSTEPAAALLSPSQQTGGRISGQFAQAVALLSPQSRSRRTSGNRGMEHAQPPSQTQAPQQQQQQQRRDGRKVSTASRSRTPGGSTSASRTPQEQREDPLGISAGTAASSTSPPEMSPRSFKSPKSGAFRHLLNVVKGGVPPSRAMSPLSMNGD
ncbi:hypothetical protein PG991_000045 [Apiospora marii]|uniref:Uncharacterized protein n=1 Tax=Apiospora marii TaxID=335849 RepID=A0ABR1T0Z5_9PEZI